MTQEDVIQNVADVAAGLGDDEEAVLAFLYRVVAAGTKGCNFIHLEKCPDDVSFTAGTLLRIPMRVE